PARSPKFAFLHLRTVRLMGHAGSDVEAAYRTSAEIAADFDRDPVLCTAKLLVERGHLSPTDALDLYEQKRAEVLELAEQVGELPQLDSPAAVMKPLTDSAVEAAAAVPERVDSDRRAQFVGSPLPEEEGPLTTGLAINRALLDVLARYPEALVFGEDVARKGGVYGVTRGLMKKAGSARVFDTLLDEQAILGLALGAGVSGLLPIPEIQYLAYRTDLTIVTFGNGVRMSLRVARRLAKAHIAARVVDMRWLAPLPVHDIVREANVTGRVLVVDETRTSGGVSEGVVAALVDDGFTGPLARVTSDDSFIPLGDAALEVLLSEDTIEAAAIKLAQVS
ncbi:MAG: hypothetical protein EOP25_00430, partial [Rhodococcus sp. (in: high G+C Gram-positive bacteria)]